MADYVYDKTPPPPALRRALDYKAWGVNLFQLPPGELVAINRAMNTYNALNAYRRAAGQNKTKEWTEQYPDAWNFVSLIIAERMNRPRI